MKNIKSSILLFSFIILSYLSLVGQTSIETLIPVDQLQSDLAILKKNLEQVHPGLYTYTSKEAMDYTFLEMEKAITKPMTAINFYRLVLPLHDKIKNGHSMIIPAADWSQALATKLPHLPFDVYQHGTQLYILRNLSRNTNLQAGDEIISINGKASMDIYNQLVDNSTKDGDNRTYPSVLLQQDFSEFYANLFGTSNIYEVAINRKGMISTFQIEGIPLAEMRKWSQERYQYDKRPWYNSVKRAPMNLKIQNGIATLTIPTFSIEAIKEDKIDYQQFFQSAFETIQQQQIEQLIIDVRDNGGGNGDIAAKLFSYLHDQPFSLLRDFHAITNQLPNKNYYEGNHFWLSLQLKVALKKEGKQRYVPRKRAAKRNLLSLGEHQPSAPQYTGNLYILTDGWSFSATGMLTSLLKEYNKGIFIGEEAGGNPHSQVGDFGQMLVLPNSGVRMIIPLFYEEMAVSFKNTRHGVQPDYPIRASIEEVLEGRDAVMDFTVDLINESIHKKIQAQVE